MLLTKVEKNYVILGVAFQIKSVSGKEANQKESPLLSRPSDPLYGEDMLAVL